MLCEIDGQRILSKLDGFFKNNDYEGARSHLLYWLGEAERANNHSIVLLLSNELMGLCRKLGERENATSFAEKALSQVQKMGIEQNVGAATTYLNSATVYKAFGFAQKAIPLFEKARAIYEANVKETDNRLAGLYNNMSLALVDLKRFDDADELYKKAIVVLEKTKGNEPEQAITYLNMATAAEAQFGLEEGCEQIDLLLKKAMELLDGSEDKQSGNYAFVCEKCATVFGYYGYFDYENQLKGRYKAIYEGN